MSSNLRRSRHHQRRKEHQTADIGYATPRARSSVRSVSVARQAQAPPAGRWTPWVLDSKGVFYWSAMRKPDGSVEYTYADNTGQRLHSPPSASPAPPALALPFDDRAYSMPAFNSSPEVQRIGLHSHGYAHGHGHRSSYGGCAASSRLLLSPIAASYSSRPRSSSTASMFNTEISSVGSGSYLAQYYQDMQRAGHVGEKRKLDMRVSRWLASLA